MISIFRSDLRPIWGLGVQCIIMNEYLYEYIHFHHIILMSQNIMLIYWLINSIFYMSQISLCFVKKSNYILHFYFTCKKELCIVLWLPHFSNSTYYFQNPKPGFLGTRSEQSCNDYFWRSSFKEPEAGSEWEGAS